MLKHLRIFALASGLLALTACGDVPPDSAYYNRGTPESLLDVSSEVVNLSAASKRDLGELVEWIEKDQPTRAELNCIESDHYCTEARKVLELSGVPVDSSEVKTQSVTLVYNRILAHDCNHRYTDNRANFYNTNHPAFGCSIAANMVQHVTDKQEFISPNIADDPSAKRAVTDYYRAYAPREVVTPYSTSQSLTGDASTE